MLFHVTRPPRAEPTETWVPPLLCPALGPGERACCCPAPAVYTVLLPPVSTGGEARSILLCAHHARQHKAALTRSSATLYDAGGWSLHVTGAAVDRTDGGARAVTGPGARHARQPR